MITAEKKACLVDIGVCKLVHQFFYNDCIPLSSTWCYKAPEELAQGQSYTRAADVYGFAGTVYSVCFLLGHIIDYPLIRTTAKQMIALAQPLEHQPIGTGLQEILTGGHCRLLDQSDYAQLTPDLRRVLRECWSFNPVQRPAMKEIETRFQEL